MSKFMVIVSVLLMVQLAWASSWFSNKKNGMGMFGGSMEEIRQSIKKSKDIPSPRLKEMNQLIANVSNRPPVAPKGLNKRMKQEFNLMGSGDIGTAVYISDWTHKKCMKLGPDTPNPCQAGFVYNKCLRSCYYVFKRSMILDGIQLNRTFEASFFGCSFASSVEATLYEIALPDVYTLQLPTILPHGVHIQSELEQSFVEYLIKLYDGEDQDYWLGGLADEGPQWLAFASNIDDILTYISGYTNWASYPDGSECMYMDSDDNYKWKVTDDCETEDKGLICEVEADYILDTPLNIGCFSGDDKVTLEDGSSKFMSNVQTGDKVLTVDGSGELVYSPIEYFSHRVEDRHNVYISIETNNGNSIELTPEHYIYKVDPNNEEEVLMRYADQIVVGDKVKVLNPSSLKLEPETVSGINIVYRKGIYNPITVHSTIVVNGILASTHAVRSQEVIDQHHLPYLVLDWFTEFIGKTFPHAADNDGHHISTYARPAKQWLVNYYGLAPNYIADKQKLFGQLNKGAMDLNNNNGGALKVPFIRSN